MKILIAEDEEDMRRILALYLKREGYQVAEVPDGGKAMDYLMEHPVDLLLLDWMMPVMNGPAVCQEVKRLGIPSKIIMLTAKCNHENEFTGLSCGADDYVRKPFDMKVLLLRIRKLLRQGEILRCGSLALNPETFSVCRGAEQLTMTRREFELLSYLMANKNITVTREQILNHVWGQDYEGDIRTVDTHIRRLRSKLGDGYIRTSVGIGYMLEEAHE